MSSVMANNFSCLQIPKTTCSIGRTYHDKYERMKEHTGNKISAITRKTTIPYIFLCLMRNSTFNTSWPVNFIERVSFSISQRRMLRSEEVVDNILKHKEINESSKSTILIVGRDWAGKNVFIMGMKHWYWENRRTRDQLNRKKNSLRILPDIYIPLFVASNKLIVRWISLSIDSKK